MTRSHVRAVALRQLSFLFCSETDISATVIPIGVKFCYGTYRFRTLFLLFLGRYPRGCQNPKFWPNALRHNAYRKNSIVLYGGTVRLSSVTLVHPTQQYGNMFVLPNSSEIRTVCIKILENKFNGVPENSYAIYQMVPFPVTLNDLRPRFQGYDILKSNNSKMVHDIAIVITAV